MPREFAPMPAARLLSTAVLAGAPRSPSRRRGLRMPTVLQFGGYDGTSYFDDVWKLSLAGCHAVWRLCRSCGRSRARCSLVALFAVDDCLVERCLVERPTCSPSQVC